MTYSSGRPRPGSTPITLRDAWRRIWFCRLIEARLRSGTARKPGWRACALSAARSRPESANRRAAASPVSQPITRDWSI
jgi:hypothetical protein